MMKILVDKNNLWQLISEIESSPEIPHRIRHCASLLICDLLDGKTLEDFLTDFPGAIEKKSRGGRSRKHRKKENL